MPPSGDSIPQQLAYAAINHRPKGVCPSCGKCRDCGSTSTPTPDPMQKWRPPTTYPGFPSPASPVLYG